MPTPPQSGTTVFARTLAALVLAGGVAVSWLAARTSAARHDQEVRQVFAAEAASMRNLVVRQIDTYLEVLAAIGLLHDLSAQISAQDFEEFSTKGLSFQRDILGAYGFAQRMPHRLREEAE